LDHLFKTAKQQKGRIDVLWASAGGGSQSKLGAISGDEGGIQRKSKQNRMTLFVEAG
jgi:hypothetical protein